MKLFTIGDLHLSFGADKPMDIFKGWDNYQERLSENWQKKIKPDDIVVLPGDFSWAISLEEAIPDFQFVENLNGNKILLKGNHDYWWETKTKMDRFLEDNGFKTFSILNNNHYRYGDIGICGTRGWINENGVAADKKVLLREAGRLEMSIRSALKENLKPVVFLHYPPIYSSDKNYEILEVIKKYNIQKCFYGHIHGNAVNYAIDGIVDDILYRLVSSDYLEFDPLDITDIVSN